MSEEEFDAILRAAFDARQRTQAEKASPAASDHQRRFDILEEFGREMIEGAVRAIQRRAPEKFDISLDIDRHRIGLKPQAECFGVTFDDRSLPRATQPAAFFAVELKAGGQARVLRSPGASPDTILLEMDPRSARTALKSALSSWVSELPRSVL